MEILWDDIENDVRDRVRQAVRECKIRTQKSAVRASNELRNSALFVLRGKRSGRTYRVPYTKSTYTASAPGEPPAVRTGTLRHSWGICTVGDGNGQFTIGIYTDVPYASLLEQGTSRMAPRPFRSRVIARATPKINNIFSDLIR